MQRSSEKSRIKSVTQEAGLPVLIPCLASEREGIATFAVVGETPQAVRAFRNEDLKDASKNLSSEEAARFNAVMRLKKAMEKTTDSAAVKHATRELQKFAPEPYGPNSPHSGSLPVSQVISRDPYKEITFWPQFMMDKLRRDGVLGVSLYPECDPRMLLSYVLTNQLRDAKLVLWWTGQKFRPALWCPDVRSAFYARVLLGVVGGKGFGLCPHCGMWFVQDRPDQTYCSISHRETHRVARWRSKQKEKASAKGKKGGEHGAKKAR